MMRVFKAALFATTLFAPAAVLAQSAAPPAANPCDQLLQALDKPDTKTTITRQQAEAFKTNSDLNSCRTALNNIQNPSGTATTTTAGANVTGTTTQTNTQAAAGAAPNAPSITIQQPAPQVTVTQAQPNVTVNQGQPELIVHQPAPTITVMIPPPEITIRMPKPEVNVSQAQPQVAVNQEKPTVQVVPSQQGASVAAVANGQPSVRFTQDEPKIAVSRNDQQPVIHFEEFNQNQQQAALGQNNQTNVQSTAAPGNTLVSDLQGKVLMGPAANDRFGTISAVIMDTKDKPFVIVDKGGQKYAVDVEYVQMKGRDLMLVGVSDPTKLPVWNDADPANRNIKRLTADQKIVVKTAG